MLLFNYFCSKNVSLVKIHSVLTQYIITCAQWHWYIYKTINKVININKNNQINVLVKKWISYEVNS